MVRFKAIAKTSMGSPISEFVVDIDTDEPIGEGDILTLQEEVI